MIREKYTAQGGAHGQIPLLGLSRTTREGASAADHTRSTIVVAVVHEPGGTRQRTGGQNAVVEQHTVPHEL